MWSFTRPGVAPYSTVTHEDYVGSGVGAGTKVAGEFRFNPFSLDAYLAAPTAGAGPPAAGRPRVPAGPLALLAALPDGGRPGAVSRDLRARPPSATSERDLDRDAGRLLQALRLVGLARHDGDGLWRLTEWGAIWVHRLQALFSLAYIDEPWGAAQAHPVPDRPPVNAFDGLRDAAHLAQLVVLRRQVPLVLGLVITDRCQLACRHCRVANITRRDMPAAQIEVALRRNAARGARWLAIEGGEPFLWRDGDAGLDDVVALARRLGYRRVHVYTNGLEPIRSDADTVWVSIGGLREGYARIRGDHFERVVANVRTAHARKLAIVYVVNRLNREELRPSLRSRASCRSST